MPAKKVLWVTFAALAVAVLAFALTRPASAGIQNVDPAGVREAISAGAQVVDVRTAGEYEMGHVPGAINVPVEQVGTVAGGWDRNATYVVYCATGSRSASAVETMKSLGFGKIKHFNAGMQAWDGEVEKGSSSAESQRVPTNGKPVFIEFFTDS